jgi:hypothetical protein
MDALIRELEIDNPLASPSAPEEHRRTRQLQSLRDDPLASMHHHHQVSDSQYRAGRRWQALWEAKAIGGTRTLDLTQTPVDGSPKGFTGLSDRQQRAAREIERLSSMLGADGTALICAVLVDGRLLRDIAGTEATKAATTFLGHRFREALTTLATAMGYAT